MQFDVIDKRLPPLFLKEIRSFVDNYFEGTQKPLKLNQKPEIIERLERLDSINNNLLNENKRINNVLDYSYVARMNISGALYDSPYMSSPYKSDDLIRLMFPVFRDTMIMYGNQPTMEKILQFDDTAEKAIDIVIQKHPKFPFGYLIKSKILYERKDSNYIIYAEKAREIFEITTAISNHSPIHDKALADLKELLGK